MPRRAASDCGSAQRCAAARANRTPLGRRVRRSASGWKSSSGSSGGCTTPGRPQGASRRVGRWAGQGSRTAARQSGRRFRRRRSTCRRARRAGADRRSGRRWGTAMSRRCWSRWACRVESPAWRPARRCGWSCGAARSACKPNSTRLQANVAGGWRHPERDAGRRFGVYDTRGPRRPRSSSGTTTATCPTRSRRLDKAWAAAHARVGEKYPGAVPYLKIVEGVKDQLLSGNDRPHNYSEGRYLMTHRRTHVRHGRDPLVRQRHVGRGRLCHRQPQRQDLDQQQRDLSVPQPGRPQHVRADAPQPTCGFMARRTSSSGSTCTS